MIEKLDQLLDICATWIESDIPETRLKTNDADGRPWFLTAAKYDKTLTLKDLREFTDRTSLNEEFLSRFRQEDQKGRKGISAIKVEIGLLYGFNKCFVQRYKGRMHFYRDDLSQKGARNMTAVGHSIGLFDEFKKNLDA